VQPPAQQQQPQPQYQTAPPAFAGNNLPNSYLVVSVTPQQQQPQQAVVAVPQTVVAVPQALVSPPIVAVPPQSGSQTAATTLYQSQSSITYYAPQTQSVPRPTSLPQRRPANPIPILAPPDRKNRMANRSGGNSDGGGDNDDGGDNRTIADSAENIDNYLENMFMQRQPYQPPAIPPSSSAMTTRKSPSPVSMANSMSSVTTTSATPSAITLAIEQMSVGIDKSMNLIESISVSCV
jgi:protein CASC3